MRLIVLIFLVLCGCGPKTPTDNKNSKIGLCVVATGPYLDLALEMIDSARQYFCKGHEVTYFVFTDGKPPPADDVVVARIERVGWPFATLERFHVYDGHKALLSKMDYIFATDADMLFVAPVGEEILAKSVGVSRDVGIHLTYERNKKSRAYMSKKKARHYFAGAFYGGEREEFFKMVGALKGQVDTDLAWNYIAVFHDESHLNRYFYDHPPRVILNTSYCYPEDSNMPYEKKLIARTKNHKEYQVEIH